MRIKNSPHNMTSNSKGFSLLEVLISVFILAIGILGLASLQLNSLKNNHSALYRTSATILAYDIIDRTRLNKNENYSLAMTATPAGTGQKNIDLIAWIAQISSELPSGDGSIVMADDFLTVTVQWDDSRGSEGSSTQSFTVSSER